MGNIGKATEPRSINNQWQPTQVTDIYLTVPCSPSIIHVQTACIWLREKERWLFDEVVDHVGIYGSKGAEGLSAFNAGLVKIVSTTWSTSELWLCIYSVVMISYSASTTVPKCYWPISQISQCTGPISHNVPFCNRNVHVCTFLLQNSALWDICQMHCGIYEIGLISNELILQRLF